MVKRIGLGLLTLVVLVAVGPCRVGAVDRHQSRPHRRPRRAYDVRIARDSYGVPHIFGATDPDVAYGIACGAGGG